MNREATTVEKRDDEVTVIPVETRKLQELNNKIIIKENVKLGTN